MRGLSFLLALLMGLFVLTPHPDPRAANTLIAQGTDPVQEMASDHTATAHPLSFLHHKGRIMFTVGTLMLVAIYFRQKKKLRELKEKKIFRDDVED